MINYYMDMERYERFKAEADSLIMSSNWVTIKMDEALRRAEDAVTVDELMICDKELECLELKAYFEDSQMIKFRKKYSDIIDC
tara:strand:- start:190 stop:438 length:249 start_codon:yes stop_codon:yes gene_type:complete